MASAIAVLAILVCAALMVGAAWAMLTFLKRLAEAVIGWAKGIKPH